MKVAAALWFLWYVSANGDVVPPDGGTAVVIREFESEEACQRRRADLLSVFPAARLVCSPVNPSLPSA